MAHAELPKIVLLLLALLWGAIGWGALAAGTPWAEAAPFLVLASVFLAAGLTVWGVQRALEDAGAGAGGDSPGPGEEAPAPREEPGASLDPLRPGGR